jgi:hypothetical protein
LTDFSFDFMLVHKKTEDCDERLHVRDEFDNLPQRGDPSTQHTSISATSDLSGNTRAGVNPRYASTLQVVLAAKFLV